MATAESRVVVGEPVLGQLFAAAEQAANRLAYFTNPELDSWLAGEDAPIAELDELEAKVWREFVRRIRAIASRTDPGGQPPRSTSSARLIEELVQVRGRRETFRHRPPAFSRAQA
jgi:hypothetical protein